MTTDFNPRNAVLRSRQDGCSQSVSSGPPQLCRYHLPLSQGAQRRAEAERRPCRFVFAPRQLGSRQLSWGLGLMCWARTRLHVEVLQDVVVDLGGDFLLLQHLLDGLVGGAGSDRLVLPRGSSGLAERVNEANLQLDTFLTNSLSVVPYSPSDQ